MIRRWLAAHVWAIDAPYVACMEESYLDYGVIVTFGWEW